MRQDFIIRWSTKTPFAIQLVQLADSEVNTHSSFIITWFPNGYYICTLNARPILFQMHTLFWWRYIENVKILQMQSSLVQWKTCSFRQVLINIFLLLSIRNPKVYDKASLPDLLPFTESRMQLLSALPRNSFGHWWMEMMGILIWQWAKDICGISFQDCWKCVNHNLLKKKNNNIGIELDHVYNRSTDTYTGILQEFQVCLSLPQI